MNKLSHEDISTSPVVLLGSLSPLAHYLDSLMLDLGSNPGAYTLVIDKPEHGPRYRVYHGSLGWYHTPGQIMVASCSSIFLGLRNDGFTHCKHSEGVNRKVTLRATGVVESIWPEAGKICIDTLNTNGRKGFAPRMVTTLLGGTIPISDQSEMYTIELMRDSDGTIRWIWDVVSGSVTRPKLTDEQKKRMMMSLKHAYNSRIQILEKS